MRRALWPMFIAIILTVTQMTISSINDWNAQLLRLTIFTTEVLSGDVDFWEKAVGVPPETIEKRARQGFTSQSGTVDDLRLDLNINIGRVDWFFHGPQELMSLDQVHIGPASVAIERFVEMMVKWIPTIPFKVSRIAFGAILLRSASDRAAAYARLQSLLSNVKLEPEESEGFVYQINRPIASQKLRKETRLNRVTKWGSVRVAIHTAQHALDEKMELQRAEASYVRLECDNSSPASDGNVYTNDEVLALFNELISLAVENAEYGEKPPK